MERSWTLDFFRRLVEIKSVSTNPLFFSEIKKTALFLKEKLESLGFKVLLLEKEKVPPLIIAFYQPDHCKNANIKPKTIGIYGHYDVQPEEPKEKWESPPFELTLKNGKFFGRGTADNKGAIVQNITAVKNLIESRRLKNNIVFILEGEEETGSIHFEEYVKKVKEVLGKVDVFYLTDVGMHKKNLPQIFYGLRGIIAFELKIKIGGRDLHSGIYGNAVFNPAQILSELFSKIKNSRTGKILIPRFYKNLRKISRSELLLLKKTVRPEKEEKKLSGVYRLLKIDDIAPSLVSKIYPSFDINGFSYGYQGAGIKTIISAEAVAKFSFRLVEYQDPDEIENLVKNFIRKNLPKGIKYELKTLAKSSPFYCNLKNPYLQKTAEILSSEFKTQCLFNRSGGSVPAAEILSRLFKKPVILTGFTLPDDNIHAPNENFDEEMFWKGIEVLEKIYTLI